jgi:hypothetical protein
LDNYGRNQNGLLGGIQNDAARNAYHRLKNPTQDGNVPRNYVNNPVEHFDVVMPLIYVHPSDHQVLAPNYNAPLEQNRKDRNAAERAAAQHTLDAQAFALTTIFAKINEQDKLTIANGQRLNNMPFDAILLRIQNVCMPNTHDHIMKINEKIAKPWVPGQTATAFINTLENNFEQKGLMLDNDIPEHVKVETFLNGAYELLAGAMAHVYDTYRVRLRGEISQYRWDELKELCILHEQTKPTKPILKKAGGKDRRVINSVSDDTDASDNSNAAATSNKKGGQKGKGGKGGGNDGKGGGNGDKSDNAALAKAIRAKAISAYAAEYDMQQIQTDAAISSASARGSAAKSDSRNTDTRKADRIRRPRDEWEPCQFCFNTYGGDQHKCYQHTENDCSNNPRNKAVSSAAAGGGGGSRTSSSRAREGGSVKSHFSEYDEGSESD